jgi:hypothetical protein
MKEHEGYRALVRGDSKGARVEADDGDVNGFSARIPRTMDLVAFILDSWLMTE